MNCFTLRGGSYRRIAQCCGSVTRMLFGPDDSMRSFGFRLVLPLSVFHLVLPHRIYRGGDFKDDVSYLRSPYSEAESPKSSFRSHGFRLVLPHRTSPMPLPLLRGGSWSGGPRNCRSADCLHVLSDYSSNIIGLRLVFPHRILPTTNRAIRGKGYLSDQPTSTQRDGEYAGRTVNLLGFRIVAPTSIAPPSQQPKVISLISIAVCDDGSVSIHIGKQ